jgi:uncharacterized protein (DUF58 family)
VLAWRPTTKATCYTSLVVLGLVAALVSGRPEAAVLAAPFAVALGAGFLRTRPLGMSVTAVAGKPTATEGDEVPVALSFRAEAEVPGLEVLVCPAPGFSLAGAAAKKPLAESVHPGQPLELSVPLVAERWGNFELGTVALRARSWLGLFEAGASVPVEGRVLVFPRPEALRRLVRSRVAALPAGTHLSPAKGGGLDLAGVRPYAAGDRAKDVNWRSSARHGGLYINERHPERGSDVVLVVDTFDQSVLHRAVTAACSLADAYLSQRDRLALLELGGALRWLRPGMGSRQRYLIVESLLSTAALASAVYRGVALLPPRLLPAAALVVGLSSLEHEGARDAFADMRARGLDVVVVEIPPRALPAPALGQLGVLAHRLWKLELVRRRERLRAAGVPTVAWEPGTPLAQVVEEVDAWARRQARSAS